MVKLICAMAGAAGRAFPVEIDASQLVGDVKEAIKDKNKNNLEKSDADKLKDAFLCLEDATKGFFHEVHQCKCVEGKLSLDNFKHMRSKAAGPDDLFILYCTSQVTADLRVLPNSAFVDATCWEAYYGPFAARAFFIKSVPLPCINTSSEVQLEFVEGVDPAYRARIAKKRPFTSLEDALVKTKNPVKVLRLFNFHTDSR
ncbi:hypothetical protein PInf_011605 [Phytophthora infestans]|nr:hypothetical protein PInf_011605 [Phytophthora infestans]